MHQDKSTGSARPFPDAIQNMNFQVSDWKGSAHGVPLKAMLL